MNKYSVKTEKGEKNQQTVGFFLCHRRVSVAGAENIEGKKEEGSMRWITEVLNCSQSQNIKVIHGKQSFYLVNAHRLKTWQQSADVNVDGERVQGGRCSRRQCGGVCQ